MTRWALPISAGVTVGDRTRRSWRASVVAFGMVVIVGAGCSTSVGHAKVASTTRVASADATTPTVPPTSTDSPQDVLLERHIASLIGTTFEDESAPAPQCMARELMQREGGSAGLEKLGIKISTTESEFSNAIDSMLEDRILTTKTEPFDRFVDALFACGEDKQFRSEFMAQLQEKGNTPAASECLTNRILGDRYLRLVLIVGQKDGTTEDPSVKTKFKEPLIAAVDRAARVCGVENW